MISWFEKHTKVSWTITIIIAVIIFSLSTLTLGSSGGSGGIYSTLYHFSAFFFFAFFLLISSVNGKHKNLTILVALIAIVYGALDELHQAFVPGRASAIRDVFVNTSGIIAATMAYTISLEYRKMKNKTSNSYPLLPTPHQTQPSQLAFHR